MKSANRGFTLMELLVVISIIGLLASVVFASLSSVREKGRNSGRVQQVKEYIKAIELYRSSSSSYLASSATWACMGRGYTGVDCWTAFGSPYTESSMDSINFRNAYGPYIPSMPAVREVKHPTLSAQDYGAMYWSANGTSYQVTWVMEGEPPAGTCTIEGQLCAYCQIGMAYIIINNTPAEITRCGVRAL